MSKHTTRKVVGSLAIAGTAAAVAGLGTFGTFTDSTTPLATSVTTGTVDINVAQPTGAIVVPGSVDGFVPGDSLSRVVDLVNSGSSPLASIALASTATTSSVLTTDTLNGLQLAVKSCSSAWTQGGTAQAPTYTCSGTQTSVASGPAVQNFVLNNAAALNPQGVDHLMFTISLPLSADNTFQGKTAALSLQFTGTQRTAQSK